MRCLDVDIVTLKSFVAVVDLAGFRKAARYLNISQPALSRRIARLEEEFAAKLVERDNNQIRLTSAGAEVLLAARKIVSEIDTALSSVRQEVIAESDLMSISCISSLAFSLLPRVIAAYKAKFRRSRIAIQDRTTPQGLQAVRDGSVDLAIVIYKDNPGESGLDYKLVYEDEYMVICSRHHPLANCGALQLKDLQNHDFVMLDKSTTNYRIINDALAKRGATVNPACEVTHVATAIEFVSHNIGIALVPRSCVTRTHDIVALRLSDLRLTRSIVVATQSEKNLDSRAQRFIDMLRDNLSSHP